MPQYKIRAILLAAGKSSRFKSQRSKLCTPLCGLPLVAYPARALAGLSIPTTAVVGYQKECVIAALNASKNPATPMSYIEQTEQRGTGHALLSSKAMWDNEQILVMNCDMPLVTPALLASLIQTHQHANATASFVTTQSNAPSAEHFGRIVKNNGHIAIVEARHYTGEAGINPELNAGIYIFKTSFLQTYALELQANSVTGELYITDLIQAASSRGLPVATLNVPFDLVRGINTLQEFSCAEETMRLALVNQCIEAGVFCKIPSSIYLDSTVTIAPDTVLEPGCVIQGTSQIGTGCRIGAYSVIIDSILGPDVTIMPYSRIINSTVHQKALIGPHAHVQKSTIDAQAVIGNFVEVKRSTIGKKSKAKHLSYLGDAQIGSGTNIGAGTITCNYDGHNKHQTIIRDNVFIGSLNALVAPVTIGLGAMTAAGSAITQDVPDYALAIARAEQVNKSEYAERIRQKTAQEKKNKQA